MRQDRFLSKIMILHRAKKIANLFSRRLLTAAILVSLFFIPSLYAQNKLDVDGDLRICSPQAGEIKNSLVLTPLAASPSGTCTANGALVYSRGDQRLYGCVGGTWQVLGSGSTSDTYEVTRIVAAYDSFGSKMPDSSPCVVSDGSGCVNLSADYTCDGVNDHYAINQAIRDLPQTGGTVYLLAGTYNISGNFMGGWGPGIQLVHGDRLSYGNIVLMGAGSSTILRLVTGSINPSGIITMHSQGTPMSGFTIKQLAIDGNGRAGGLINGIHVLGGTVAMSNIAIDKVWVRDMSGEGIFLKGALENVSVFNSYIRNNAGEGIYIFGDPAHDNRRMSIYGNRIFGNGKDGISVFNLLSSDFSIQYNYIESNAYHGVKISGLEDNFNIQGNIIKDNGSAGVYDGINLWAVNSDGYSDSMGNYSTNMNGLICENIIFNNSDDGQYDTDAGINLSNAHNMLLTRNIIQYSSSHGMKLGSSRFNVIIGNAIANAGGASSTGAYYGIEIGFNSLFNNILANHISDFFPGTGSSCYGIYLNSGGSANFLKSGYLYANQINDYGAYNGKRYLYNSSILGSTAHWPSTDKMTMNLFQHTVSGISGTLWPDPGTCGIGVLVLGDCQGSTITEILPGRAVGDLLILVNHDSTPQDAIVANGLSARTALRGNVDRILNYGDTITLLWDGSRWVEISFGNNDASF